MEKGKCKECSRTILYLNTRAHIQFGGVPPPVQPQLPGWDYELKEIYRPKAPRRWKN